jgi:hypothetical protein
VLPGIGRRDDVMVMSVCLFSNVDNRDIGVLQGLKLRRVIR